MCPQFDLNQGVGDYLEILERPRAQEKRRLSPPNADSAYRVDSEAYNIS